MKYETSYIMKKISSRKQNELSHIRADAAFECFATIRFELFRNKKKYIILS